MKLKIQQKRLSKGALILIICFLFLGCHSQASSTRLQSENCQSIICVLENNRALWQKKGVADYNLVMSLDAHGVDVPAKPVLVEVRNNKAISIKAVSISDKRSFFYYETLGTVEKMFDVIQEEDQKGSKTEVSYNQEFGYPENILVYPANSISGNYHLTIDKFEIINTN